LRGKQVDPANDLYDVDEQDIVASGVAEIARLQGQGFAYIRP
jgi:intracellular sulfur oxidation DsrE/DsrF family protein